MSGSGTRCVSRGSSRFDRIAARALDPEGQAEPSTMTGSLGQATTTLRIAMSIWFVLLPLLPAPVDGAPDPAPEPAAPVTGCCGSDAAAPASRCCSNAPDPCAAAGTCSRCPVAQGPIVFLAPVGVGLEMADHTVSIRPDAPVPLDMAFDPPERPPQASPSA